MTAGLVKRLAAPRPRTGHYFLRLVPLAFAAAMFIDFLWELRGNDEIAQIGTFNLHGADIATAIGLLALLAARPGLRSLNTVTLLVLAIGGLVAFSLLRGVLENPFQAGIAFRFRAVTLVFIFYVALSRRKLEPFQHSEPWLVTFIWLYVGLFCLRLLFGPTLFLLQDSTAYLNIIGLEFRSLNAETILILDFALLMFLHTALRTRNGGSRNFYIVLAVTAFVVIVLSRQRTASVAGLIGLATLFLTDFKLLRRHAFLITMVGISAIAALGVWAVGLLPDLIQMLPEQFQISVQRTQTLSGREEIWAYSLGWRFANWDIIRQLFGPPAGEALNIMTIQGLWKSSLHSQYVATIMNYGIVGAFAWGSLLMVGIFRALRELPRETANLAGLSPSLVLAWLATLLVYGYAYEWADGAGVFLAMALAGWPPSNVHKKMVLPRGNLVRSA